MRVDVYGNLLILFPYLVLVVGGALPLPGPPLNNSCICPRLLMGVLLISCRGFQFLGCDCGCPKGESVKQCSRFSIEPFQFVVFSCGCLEQPGEDERAVGGCSGTT